MAAPLTVPRPARVGRTRSRWRTTSRIERSRSNAIPMTSHTTYSAGSLRRRIVAVPVACNACAIHSASSVSLKSSKLGARSPAPTARMASPNSDAPAREDVPWPDDDDAPPASASDGRDAMSGRARDHHGDGADGTMADVRGPWTRAVPAADFLAGDDPTLNWLIPRLLAPGSLTY